jgi:hypothetical protein
MKRILFLALIVSTLLEVIAEAKSTNPLPIWPVAYKQDDYCGEVCIQETLGYLGKRVFQPQINKAGD